jgi:hypothetical protein
MKILEDQWKCSKKTIIFNVKKNKILYRLLKKNWGANGITELVVKFCFFNYLEQINNSMCDSYLQIRF